MANLEGMPIGSLPEATEIQDEDEVVVYRPSTGKAYQANTDLIDSSSIFERGTAIPIGADMNDYTTCGNYYIADSTISSGGISNFPESITGGGKVLIIPSESVNRPVQIFISKNIPINGICYRALVGSSNWSTWYKITATSIS